MKYCGVALHQETQEIVSATDVTRGAGCGCVCLECGGPLLARQGEIREHHFAHINDCKNGNGESFIHKYAKELVAAATEITVPDEFLVADVFFVNSDGVCVSEKTRMKAVKTLNIYEQVVEPWDQNSYRPDLSAKTDLFDLHIEIKNTHGVDWYKQKKVRKPMLEIDVREWINCKTKSELDEYILQKARRKWIVKPDENTLILGLSQDHCTANAYTAITKIRKELCALEHKKRKERERALSWTIPPSATEHKKKKEREIRQCAREKRNDDIRKWIKSEGESYKKYLRDQKVPLKLWQEMLWLWRCGPKAASILQEHGWRFSKINPVLLYSSSGDDIVLNGACDWKVALAIHVVNNYLENGVREIRFRDYIRGLALIERNYAVVNDVSDIVRDAVVKYLEMLEKNGACSLKMRSKGLITFNKKYFWSFEEKNVFIDLDTIPGLRDRLLSVAREHKLPFIGIHPANNAAQF